jgi:UDP-N-acetyl-2-amino-2-deoxyglucuronate dehydrogenase
MELEEESGRKINTVLQLRLHPSIIALREKIQNGDFTDKVDIELSYITSRGPWYLFSWKGNHEQSGGLTTNIGIHFFDMLLWIFGGVQKSEVHIANPRTNAGYLELEKARVKWFLSVDKEHLPESAVKEGKPSFRSLLIGGEEFEFSGGFTDLHTRVYENVLEGNGFGVKDAKASISLAHDIRHADVKMVKENLHPIAKGK